MQNRGLLIAFRRLFCDTLAYCAGRKNWGMRRGHLRQPTARKGEVFQMIGASNPLLPIIKGFYGSKRVIMYLFLHLHLPELAKSRSSTRPLLPFAAKIGISVAVISRWHEARRFEGSMMFSAADGAKGDVFQMIGTSNPLLPIIKGFYGSKRVIMYLFLHLHSPELAKSRSSTRPLLPFAAKIGISVAVISRRFGAIALDDAGVS